MRHRRSTRTCQFALVAILVASLSAPVKAADASLVFAALLVLKDNHVDSPDPVKLLAAALGGLRQALTRAGITEPLADLRTADEGVARADFQDRFDQAVSLAAGRVGETQLQYAAAAAMAASLGDSQTSFITPEQYRASLLRQRGQASYSGIGVFFLRRSGKIYLFHVFPGGPAARAGLRDLDRLLAVDGENVQGMELDPVRARIMGPPGTVVRLEVQRFGENAPLRFSITREPILIPAVEHSILERQLGYLRFLRFSDGSAGQVRSAIAELQRQEMRGLVLDLRDNGGGLYVELNAVVDSLLPSGSVAYTERTRQGRTTHLAQGTPVLPPGVPLVILVNESMGGPAEVLAAALQANARAQVVGVKTDGTVVSSRPWRLPGDAGIIVAVAHILSPNGVDLEGTGVTPDVVIEMNADDLDRGIDTQLRRALEMVQTKSLRRLGPSVRAYPNGRSKETLSRLISVNNQSRRVRTHQPIDLAGGRFYESAQQARHLLDSSS